MTDLDINFDDVDHRDRRFFEYIDWNDVVLAISLECLIQ